MNLSIYYYETHDWKSKISPKFWSHDHWSPVTRTSWLKYSPPSVSWTYTLSLQAAVTCHLVAISSRSHLLQRSLVFQCSFHLIFGLCKSGRNYLWGDMLHWIVHLELVIYLTWNKGPSSSHVQRITTGSTFSLSGPLHLHVCWCLYFCMLSTPLMKLLCNCVKTGVHIMMFVKV